VRGRSTAVALVALLAAAGLATGGGADARRHRHRLLHVGDSLAVGTQWYLPAALRGWRVRKRTSISMQASAGPRVLRSYGRGLPRVIVVSLGTNGDPRATGSFRHAIRASMHVVGHRRCVVWANLYRPPVAGASYRRLNGILAKEARKRRNLRVFQWVRMARAHRGWFGSDGVHPVGVGYRARARGIAKIVRRCLASLRG
jgi:lysophospholipase L1-like esterase